MSKLRTVFLNREPNEITMLQLVDQCCKSYNLGQRFLDQGASESRRRLLEQTGGSTPDVLTPSLDREFYKKMGKSLSKCQSLYLENGVHTSLRTPLSTIYVPMSSDGSCQFHAQSMLTSTPAQAALSQATYFRSHQGTHHITCVTC